MEEASEGSDITRDEIGAVLRVADTQNSGQNPTANVSLRRVRFQENFHSRLPNSSGIATLSALSGVKQHEERFF